MPSAARKAHLTTVVGAFHAQVLLARLGTEGIGVELRGLSSGPYPLPGNVEVFVFADQLDLAREILLADEVDAAFDERYDSFDQGRLDSMDLAPPDELGLPLRHHVHTLLIAAMVLMVLVVGVVTSLR